MLGLEPATYQSSNFRRRAYRKNGPNVQIFIDSYKRFLVQKVKNIAYTGPRNLDMWIRYLFPKR